MTAADVDIDGGTGISIEADNNADASIVLKTNNATGVITLDSKDKASILSGDMAKIDSAADIDIDGGTGISIEADNNADANRSEKKRRGVIGL